MKNIELEMKDYFNNMMQNINNALNARTIFSKACSEETISIAAEGMNYNIQFS